ncbi:hypothetical protein LCGC14_0713500 [marine sediment metagenome]|uniref:PARP-type domain-containing protein n=1 Tax=marine sediment metagenome TaxID=412755 RepID=A0A0F9QIV2_9ZZZZ
MPGTMMTWWKWCRRTLTCRECLDDITPGEMMVQGSYRSENGFYIRSYWHADCHIKQAKDYLSAHPFEPMHAGPGRPRMELSDEDRTRRKTLQTQYVRIKNRMKEINTGGLYSIEGAQSATRMLWPKLLRIADEMEELGGVPSRWLRDNPVLDPRYRPDDLPKTVVSSNHVSTL